MESLANTAVALTGIACFAGILMSLYPGLLTNWNALVFFVVLGGAAIAGLAAVFAVFVLVIRGKLTMLIRQATIVFALLLGTYVLLEFYVPRRIAFAAFRGKFEEFVPAASEGDDRKPMNRWLGIYHVDEHGHDSRGGVYFRVYSVMDGFSFNRLSFGFAYKPNPYGSPFGRAEYRVFPLGRDWFWFRASNDY